MARSFYYGFYADPFRKHIDDDSDDVDGDPVDADDAGYIDEHDNVTLRAFDELGIMRKRLDLSFVDVLHDNGDGYLFSKESSRWESEDGWFTIFNERAENLQSPLEYDIFQSYAESESGQPFLVLIGVSKNDYPEANDAFQSIAAVPMGGTDNVRFSSNGT